MKALVRRPGPRVAEGLVTHIDRAPVDPRLALRQWEGYVEALRAHGWDPVEVPPADDCPDAVFVEDTMVVWERTAVIARPGAPTRSGETVAAEQVVRELGYDVARVEAPATLDGGDVLKVGRTVHVGVGGRTNAAGARRLAGVLGPLGAEVVPVPVRSVLHLKSGVTALPDGTVVGFAPLVDDASAYDRFLAVPEPSGAHVVVLDPTTVLMAADAPRSARLFRERGLDVVEVDIGEYEKLEGCVTCLSVRLRHPGSQG